MKHLLNWAEPSLGPVQANWSWRSKSSAQCLKMISICSNFSPEMKIDTCTSIYTPGLGGKDFVFASPFSLVFSCQVQPNNVETITKTLETSLDKTVTLDS